MNTEELTGADLALWVARAIKMEFVMRGDWPAEETEFASETHCNESSTKEWKCWLYFKPHEDWSQGGPLIEKYKIGVACQGRDSWTAAYDGPSSPMAETSEYPSYWGFQRSTNMVDGPTPLVAAMRALVFSVYGENVEDSI